MFDRSGARGRRAQAVAAQALGQRDAVVGALDALGRAEVVVTAYLCFVDGDVRDAGAITVDGVKALSPQAAIRHLRGRGPLGRAEIARIAEQLHTRFPPRWAERVCRDAGLRRVRVD